MADFGLARLALDAVTHVTTRVMGTFGWVNYPANFKINIYMLQSYIIHDSIPFSFYCRYMAPEYASSGKLTERSDVFSFGVVLLEIITGQRPVDASRPLGNESLVEWVSSLLMFLRHFLFTVIFWEFLHWHTKLVPCVWWFKFLPCGWVACCCCIITIYQLVGCSNIIHGCSGCRHISWE